MPVTYQRQPRQTYPTGVSASTSESLRRRYVDDLIVNVSPRDIPFQKLAKMGNPVTNMKVEWLQDNLLGNSTTLTSSPTASPAALDQDVLSVATGTGAYFQYGSVVRLRRIVSGSEQSEICWVYAEPSGDNVPVIRRYDSASAISTLLYTDTSHTVDIIGIAVSDNIDSPRKSTTVLDQLYNYVQQYDMALQVSHAQGQMDLYGVSNDMDYQTGHALKELAILFERDCFQGVRVAPDTTNARPALMGGLNQYVTSNVTDQAGSAITELVINNTLQAIWDAVGQGNFGDPVIICNSAVKRQISRLYSHASGNNYQVQLPQSKTTGGVVVNNIETEFGEIRVLMHKFCPSTCAYFLNMGNIEICPLKGSKWFVEGLAKSGPYDKQHLYGAYTMVVKAPTTHGLVKNLSTTVS